jgi:subfamily B ATP-binding cassette protein MsbA
MIDIDPELVYGAAKAANAHNFITQMSEGYDTIIGEKGSRLSGGQKQRIAIARAILNNPEIIIFDEATSALDSEAEMLIQEAMANIIKNRTVIMVAHRLSTIKHADRILVVSEGSIIEEGSHDDLMSANGSYKYIHDLQFNSDHSPGRDDEEPADE